MADEPYGVLDEAMLRPPQIAGCERIPFLVMLGAVAFVTVTGFGLTLPGAIGGILLAAAGVMVLRRIAVHDPFWFAILFEAATFPRRMPDVPPDRTIPQDLAFVGYADPPSPAVVALHRTAAAAVVVVPAAATWLLFGLVPALCTLGVLAVAVAAVLVRKMPRSSTPEAG